MNTLSLIRRKWVQEGPKAVLFASVPYGWMLLSTRIREFSYAIRGFIWGQFTLQIRGLRVDVESEVLDDEMISELRRGRYEFAESELVTKFVTGEHDIIELGAGIGVVSGVINSRLDKNRTHVAVEADEDKISLLRSTRRMNDLQFRIEHAAYASNRESISLFKHSHPPSSSVLDRNNVSESAEVPGIDLAKICEKYDIDEFMLVADIEGAEFDLLEGEIELLESACRGIILEFHDFTEHCIGDYKRLLKSCGFNQMESLGDVYYFER